MYIKDGIAYAGEPEKFIHVCGVKALPDYVLWIRFDNGESKTFDCKPLLDKPCYLPLKDPETFKSVYIDYGTVVWNDGAIDIAPDNLFKYGK